MKTHNKLYKYYVLTILLIIYFIVFIFFLTIRGSFRFNVLYINEETYNNIINTRIPIDEDVLATIKLNNHDLFKADNDELFYSMVEKEKNKYNPFLKIYANIDDFKIALYGNTITAESIKNSEQIKLIVYNETHYKEYEIVATTLPIMNIIYEENKENNEHIQQKAQDVFGKFYLYDNEKNEETMSNLKIHVRGGTSTFFPKKGFKLSLKGDDGYSINTALLDMREDDDWLLYAGYTDQEMIRNVFSSRIWYDCFADDNVFGVKAGMYYKYVELFFNGKYWGLYALGFPIDSKQLQIESGENLYKKEIWSSDNTIFEEGVHIENAVYNIKSNTLMHYDLEEYINKFNTYNNVNDILDLIDVDNNTNFYIYNLLVQNEDAVISDRSKNLYIAFKRDDNQNIKAMYVPWDLDYTFGNINNDSFYDNYTESYGLDYKYTENHHTDSPIGKIIMLDPEYSKMLIKERWSKIRTRMTNGYITTILSKYENDIFNSGAYIRDMNKWNLSSKNNNYNLDEFKKYVFDRLDYFDNYINEL